MKIKFGSTTIRSFITNKISDNNKFEFIKSRYFSAIQ